MPRIATSNFSDFVLSPLAIQSRTRAASRPSHLFQPTLKEVMHQYLDLVRTVFEQGDWQKNRTGIRTLSISGASLRLDLQKGFPAVTTRKTAFKTAMGEMVAFLRASQSAADFRALGCKVWDQNANENKAWLANPYRQGEDHLGPVYGAMWRQWPGYKVLDQGQTAQLEDALGRGYRQVATFDEGNGPKVLLHRSIDQIRSLLDTLISNPGDRRMLFHAWNPAVLEEVALPACHTLYSCQANQAKKELSMCLFIRSSDIGLGLPLNVIEAAALVHLFARLTGFTPRWLNVFLADAHIYENQVDMLKEQLTREPYALPKLVLSERVPDYAVTGKYEPEWLDKVEPSDFTLEGYQHHPPLTAPMAV